MSFLIRSFVTSSLLLINCTYQSYTSFSTVYVPLDVSWALNSPFQSIMFSKRTDRIFIWIGQGYFVHNFWGSPVVPAHRIVDNLYKTYRRLSTEILSYSCYIAVPPYFSYQSRCILGLHRKSGTRFTLVCCDKWKIT